MASCRPCDVQFEVLKHWNRVGGVPFRKPFFSFLWKIQQNQKYLHPELVICALRKIKFSFRAPNLFFARNFPHH